MYAINEHQGQFAKNVIGNFYDLISVSGPRAAAVATRLSNTSHWSPERELSGQNTCFSSMFVVMASEHWNI